MASSHSAPLGGTALSLRRVNPIKLLVLVAVINGVDAAPFLVVVMRPHRPLSPVAWSL
jgi:hypothetical protein